MFGFCNAQPYNPKTCLLCKGPLGDCIDVYQYPRVRIFDFACDEAAATQLFYEIEHFAQKA